MYWLQQTRRAFQRQHDQRTEACQQATPAAGVGRRSWRLTRNTARTSMLSARCTGQCVPSQHATDPCLASVIRARAHRREVLPYAAASLRSDSGLPSWRLAR
jgi:hypothetical protein